MSIKKGRPTKNRPSSPPEKTARNNEPSVSGSPSLDIESVSDKFFQIKPETIGLALLAAFDLLIIGPGSWLLNSLDTRYTENKERIESKISQIETQVEELSKILHSDYVDKETYRADQSISHHRISDIRETLSDLQSQLIKSNP